MCQSNVYALKGDQEELILEEVAFVEVDGNRITMLTLFGEPVSVNAQIKHIDLMKHRIVLRYNQTGSS